MDTAAELQRGDANPDLVAYRWLGFVNETDASGRPLSEGSAPPQARPEGAMEYVACPYADTRASANKPMNRSALVSMTACWQQICDWSRTVSRAYQARWPVREFTFLDLWRVAAVLRTAPFFILLRRSAEADRRLDEIPEWVAGAYKAARGVEDAVLHMACIGTDVRRAYDFDSLYDFVCKHRLFEGSAEVCAGSPALVKSFVEQIALASLQGAPGRSQPIRHPIASGQALDRLLDYAACETLVESLSLMYEVGRFRSLDLRRCPRASDGQSAESAGPPDDGRYPLSALARALSRNYGPANERLLRNYLRLAFPENASVCAKLLDEPLLIESRIADAPDGETIARHADRYLGRVSDELLEAERRIRSILGIEAVAALPSRDCLAALFGPCR
jgi:hypothetical protein